MGRGLRGGEILEFGEEDFFQIFLGRKTRCGGLFLGAQKSVKFLAEIFFGGELEKNF